MSEINNLAELANLRTRVKILEELRDIILADARTLRAEVLAWRSAYSDSEDLSISRYEVCQTLEPTSSVRATDTSGALANPLYIQPTTQGELPQ